MGYVLWPTSLGAYGPTNLASIQGRLPVQIRCRVEKALDLTTTLVALRDFAGSIGLGFSTGWSGLVPASCGCAVIMRYKGPLLNNTSP